MFDIDLCRFIVEKKLNNEKLPVYSFFEPITEATDTDRYIDNIQSTINEQMKLNDNYGIATITCDDMEISNLKTNYICSFNTSLHITTNKENLSYCIKQYNNLIRNSLNGRRYNLVVDENDNIYEYKELDTSNLTSITNKENFIGYSKNFGTYTGEYIKANASSITTEFYNYLADQYGVSASVFSTYCIYVIVENKYLFMTGVETIAFIGLVDLYRVDMNMSAFVSDTPMPLNGEEYVYITTSGNATICDHSVVLGNDLKVEVSTDGITYYEVETTTMPSSLGLNKIGSQTSESGYVENKIIIGATNSLSYAFIVNDNVFIRDLFFISKYGYKVSTIGLTENTIWFIRETHSVYSIDYVNTLKAKLISLSSVNNTADVETISCDFAIQEGV